MMIKQIDYQISDADWEQYFLQTPKQFIEMQKLLLKQRKQHLNHLDKLLYYFAFHCSPFYSQKCIETIQTIYRARIYWAENDSEPVKAKDNPFQGYNKVDSFIPPVKLVSEGRVNKKNIVYLYAASKLETALAEVEPCLSNDVSVAEIKINQLVHLFNMALWNIGIDSGNHVRDNWVDRVILDLAECFYSINTKKEDYHICQYIGQFVKSLGFDGIQYYSSKNRSNLDGNAGINYAIFNYEKCEPKSSILVHVLDVHYDYI